jgi:oxygen-independent coproporphyrinogen III oxidase
MKPEIIYERGLLFHHYANTAYPLTPTSFAEYRLKNDENIEQFLMNDFSKIEALSLYVHVPFCKKRCKFCEYVVLEETNDETQDEYIELLLKEMKMYSKLLKGKKIVGYDLGGGTPSSISSTNLKRITESITHLFDFAEGTTFSVETTPSIAANDIEKIESLYRLGYRRISMGIQTISEKLLNELGREGTLHVYERAVDNIRSVGFRQFNIDLMYGFLHQSDEEFENTLWYTIGLNPDFITLYRNRYKGTKIETESGGVSLYKIIRQYNLAYAILNEAGYLANPGKNTFSKVANNYGTSDYLTRRVVEGVPYVGMGLGAQSFGVDYLAYNDGAANKQIKLYKKKIEEGKFPIQDIYKLPLSESISKVISVAFYFGFIDLTAFKKRFNIELHENFEREIEFLLNHELMEMKDNRLLLTSRGADYINGIIPLFYSERAKQELLELSNKKVNRTEDEKMFLSAYSMDDFVRPSVTSDCIVFRTLDNQKEVLLIRRGEHPYMNCYALPGGFVRNNETVDEAAYRELEEETGVSKIELSLFQVFSKPGRDPRGWVISNVFRGTLLEEQQVKCGSDSIDVAWVNVSELSSFDLAFDHREMIEKAL